MARERARQAAEGVQYQGEDEAIAYTYDVTAIGNSPTAVSVVVKDVARQTDVTSATMPSGSATVLGNVIKLPHLKNLARGRLYRVEIQFTIDGNELESYLLVEGEE